MTTVATSSVHISAEAACEPGDRLPAWRTPRADELLVPPEVATGLTPFVSLEDSAGRPLKFRVDPVNGTLSVYHLHTLAPPESLVRLECKAPGEFRLICSEDAAAIEAPAQIRTDGSTIEVLEGDDRRLLFHHAGRAAGLASLELAVRAARLATQPGFDQLIALPLVREMELLEHQIRTAKTVLRRFRGRAMLCDEVGLGKTIEAGLILSELSLRGLARSVLVLVPPSLIEQWQAELLRKFSLDFVPQDAAAFRQLGKDAWSSFDRIIVSTHTAKREPHRSAILARRWDLVIVDEAHHLRNRNTVLWKFAAELEKQYMLLLTATPVQNRLDELFNLVTLLEPGLLSTARQFEREFVNRRDKLAPRNLDKLHSLLAEVMVRNRRSTVGLQFTRRWAKTECVPLTADEAGLYRRTSTLVRQHLKASGGGSLSRMALLSLQMALGSSSQAAASTLAHMSEGAKDPAVRMELTSLADEAGKSTSSSKFQRLLRVLADFQDKLVIFTQFRATQAMLAQRLAEAGEEVAVFHGGLSRLEKEDAVQRFRGPARLLLCTEAGSEGRNLQFAHGVCNYDLPWNPMRIEQRIGRLSRIGQQRDVYVYNLVAAGTVEAAVLQLLDAKLSMFELVIGEIDMILGNLDQEQEFQDLVADLWTEAGDETDFAVRMEQLGDRLLAAKSAYLDQRAHDDRLFGSRFAPEA